MDQIVKDGLKKSAKPSMHIHRTLHHRWPQICGMKFPQTSLSWTSLIVQRGERTSLAMLTSKSNNV